MLESIQRTEDRSRILREKFPLETIVRVSKKGIDGYVASVASKLQERMGTVVGHQAFSGSPIVRFPASGRRKEFQLAFQYCADSLEIDSTELSKELMTTIIAEADQKAIAKRTPKKKATVKA